METKKEKQVGNRLLVVLMATLMVFFAANAVYSRGQAERAAGPEDSTIVLRVASPMSGEDRLNLMHATIDKFHQRHPNVRIDYSTEEGPQFEQNLRLTFSAGMGIEVPYVGDSQQQMLQRHGHLLDITDIVKERGWLDKQVPGAIEWQNLRTPGRYFSVPFLQSSVAIFYNKDIFSELDLEPPTDFDEFTQIMAAVKEAGYIPFEVGGVQVYHWNWMIETLIYAQVPKSEIDKWFYLQETTPAFEAAFKMGLEYMEQWAQKGYFRDDSIAIDYLDVPALYAQGRTAMVYDGDWRINIIEDTGIPTGVFVPPMIDQSLPHYRTGSPHGAFAMNAGLSEAEIQAAADWIDIFHEQEVIEMWAGRGFPVTVRYDSTQIELSPLANAFTVATRNSGIGFYMADCVPGILDVKSREVQRMVLGEINAAQAWRNIDAGYEELKAEYLEGSQ